MTLFRKKSETNSSLQAEGNKRSFLSRLLTQTALLVNFFVIAVFLLANAAKVVSPEQLLLPSYIGLAFPFLALANCFFLFWWAIRRRWHIVFSLTSILYCFDSMKETFPIHFGDKEIKGESIKVLTYNVHLFDFYKKKSQNSVLKYLQESDADVLCIQEYGFTKKKEYLKEEEISEALSSIYPYCHTDIGDVNATRTFGVATFSKYPINSKRKIQFESQHNSAILTEISVNGKAINIINCHLESNKITENDKELLKQLSSKLDNETAKQTAEHFSQKLGISYQLRAKQAEAVAKIVENSKDPIILCGDFNDVAVSYTYNTIKGNKLTSAYARNYCGYGYTFSDKLFPFRIDHILYSKGFKSYNYTIDDVNYSDHYPVYCRIVIGKKEE